MDESIEAPEPHSDLPEELIAEIDELSVTELRPLAEYVQARIQYMESPISELIEPEDDEEILRVEDSLLYTIVVKRKKSDAGREDGPHEARVYVVTIEPDMEGGRHLHWNDIGPLAE